MSRIIVVIDVGDTFDVTLVDPEELAINIVAEAAAVDMVAYEVVAAEWFEGGRERPSDQVATLMARLGYR